MSDERFTLANRGHLSVFLVALFALGGCCPKCGNGTRATSRRWARCKECGERVRRRTADEVKALVTESAVPVGGAPAAEEPT